MRKHFTNSLTVIFAVLGVYFVAFKVLMRVGPAPDPRFYPIYHLVAEHRPRWGSSFSVEWNMKIWFAPLILIERRVLGMDNWDSLGSNPEPDWMKEYGDKP